MAGSGGAARLPLKNMGVQAPRMLRCFSPRIARMLAAVELALGAQPDAGEGRPPCAGSAPACELRTCLSGIFYLSGP